MKDFLKAIGIALAIILLAPVVLFLVTGVAGLAAVAVMAPQFIGAIVIILLILAIPGIIIGIIVSKHSK